MPDAPLDPTLGRTPTCNAVRAVSLPSTTVFDRQHAGCESRLLPEGLPRIAVEAGVTDCWCKYVRNRGAVLGLDRCGESTPAADVCRHFGLTADNLVATVQAVSYGESES